METLDPQSTALLIIDLQNGIVEHELGPRNGAQIVDTARALAAQFREAGIPVVLSHVGWHRDGGDLPPGRSDKRSLPEAGTVPPGWSDLVSGLCDDGDIVVLKHQWGAFTGTDLDVQLRRRGIRTIMLGGISTNMGVESTARHAWELGYDVILVEDLCSSRDTAMHDFSVNAIMPLISRVVSIADVQEAIETVVRYG